MKEDPGSFFQAADRLAAVLQGKERSPGLRGWWARRAFYYFAVPADPLDVPAYLLGGAAAWLWWKWRLTRATPTTAHQAALPKGH